VWSGDLVRLDDDGYCYYVGRRDTMIKTSGYRVSPTEIEEIAYASGLVKQALAFGIPSPVTGQDIVLAIAMKEADSDLRRLTQYLRQHLPQYMQPRRIIERDSLPTNVHGKFDSEELRRGLAHEDSEPSSQLNSV
jgi:acyl-CoA synthetase (AMP-forming)/AMP-acid ligase II